MDNMDKKDVQSKMKPANCKSIYRSCTNKDYYSLFTVLLIQYHTPTPVMNR